MANEITSTLVSDVIVSVVNENLGKYIRENSVMLPLMKVKETGGLGKAVVFASSAVASTQVFTGTATSEGSASNQKYGTDSATATAAEYAVTTQVHRLATMSAVDLEAHIMSEIGAALLDKFDVDASALLAAFSNTVGSTGVDLSFDNLVEGIQSLRANAKGQAARGVIVLHPRQIADLRLNAGSGITSSLAPWLARSEINIFGASLQNIEGSFLGVPVISSANVPSMNSGADRGGAILVAGEALGAAIAWYPEVQIFDSRVSGFTGNRIHGSFAYGVVEVNDSLGITIVSDL
jgi:hypothetical protein